MKNYFEEWRHRLGNLILVRQGQSVGDSPMDPRPDTHKDTMSSLGK